MKKFFLLCALSSLIISCKEISGSLEVVQDFEAKVENNCGWDPFGNCEPTKKVKIVPGNYKSTVNFSSKEIIKMEVKANKVKETIVLKRPNNFEFPANGDFHLGANEIGQNFDVHGSMQTQVFESPTRREHESCTYTRNEYVCYPGQNGQPVCSYQPRQVWGYRLVEYYLKTTVRDLLAHIMEADQSKAHFTGHREDSEKIYLYQGICR